MVDVMSAYAVSGGFTDAAAIVNKLPQDVLAEMCQMILKFIKHDTGIIDTATLLSKCQSAGCSCTQEAVQSAVNVVAHIYRTASRGCLGANELSNQLQGSATWSEEAVAVIVQFWQQQTALSELSQQSCHSVNTGKLIDLQWKLGVSVGSSSCKNLNSPFVTMTIKVAEPSGHLKTRSFEMTIAQFQNFSKQLKEMASVLDTV